VKLTKIDKPRKLFFLSLRIGRGKL